MPSTIDNVLSRAHQQPRRGRKPVGNRLCWMCINNRNSARVPAVVTGCKHLARDMSPGERLRWGLCQECNDAGPCPECASEKGASKRPKAPTKAQVESYALAGTIEGREAATVSPDGRTVTYRHVWKDDLSDSVGIPLFRAVNKWALELSNHNQKSVTVYSKDGYRLEVIEPTEDPSDRW